METAVRLGRAALPLLVAGALAVADEVRADAAMDARIEALVPELEGYIASGMKAFDDPGLAIGIVSDDRLVYAKGSVEAIVQRCDAALDGAGHRQALHLDRVHAQVAELLFCPARTRTVATGTLASRRRLFITAARTSPPAAGASGRWSFPT